MAASEEEIITCYACGAPMNVADVAPYSRVVCPACKVDNRVKKKFGSYVLTRRHAIGGMSSVFVGNDEALNREVALKILSEEYSKDEKRIAAFEEEARLTASFSHPNVVRVLTTGKAFGRFYIAMEFVPGGHFEHQIRVRGTIPETELLPLAIQVAEGLKGAQAAGLIHRDVKPGNILLDAEGNAKLVDFGLALVTKGGKAKATEIWATPYYVPPEAIEGGVEDFRADIYAFGATFYHALSGKPPCDEESMATDVLREAKKRVIPLKKVAPFLTDETCAVIDRAMAYEPIRRFGSYDDMIAGLQTALKAAHGEIVKDEDGVSKAEHRAELRRRKRQSTVLIISSLVIAFAGVTTLLLLSSKDPTPVKQTVKILSIEGTEDNGETSTEIANRYRAARKNMTDGEFQNAGLQFAALLKDGNVQEPTRTWAGLESIVAAFMEGRSERAKERADSAYNHLASGPAGLDLGFVVGVQPVLRQMREMPFYQIEAMALGDQGTERFMGYLLAGLKNWEQGGVDAARPFFEKIVSEPSLASDSVFDWYQQAAKRYLQDYHSLHSVAMESQPKTPLECREDIEDLNRVLTLLETSGRARFNIRARQLDLAKLEKALAKPSLSPVETDGNVITEIEALAKDYRFVEIVDRVKKLNGDPPNCKRTSMLGIAQSALIFFTEMELDLKNKAVAFPLVLKDDTNVASLVITPEDKLVGKLPSGEIRDLKWTDFSTDQLIELHRELVKNPDSEMERLRHHESAIAFEWLTGSRERALLAAGRLSEESAGFKARWEAIASGLPK